MDPPAPRGRPPSSLLVAAILHMILRNALARALRRPRPCATATLNHARAALLADPFFDRQQQPHELRPRRRPAPLAFDDAVVLCARLLRVLMASARPGPLSPADKAERLAVRNAVLDQPFFDPARPASGNPFADDPFEDDACFV